MIMLNGMGKRPEHHGAELVLTAAVVVQSKQTNTAGMPERNPLVRGIPGLNTTAHGERPRGPIWP